MSEHRSGSSARLTLLAVVLALTAASVFFRLLMFGGWEHTSLVFLGVPAVLAIALVAVKPTTSVGTANKAIAIALCLSGIVFGEAFICILMASPIFFLIGSIVTRALQSQRGKTLGLMIILPMSFEGVVAPLELNRDETVSATRVINADVETIRAKLAAPMRFDAELPLFFRLGFPTPGATSGEGIAVGDRRSVEFLHGEHHPGRLVLQVAHADAERVVFMVVSDDSYITHWLAWQHAEVQLTALSASQTRVTWTLRYRRRLDPAWYFAPLERYGVGLAAEYLLGTLTTPRP